jgi:uncharacterized 2Fe-2S/4Fe-4S cluster protein (DUF4445 family)
MSRLGVTLDLGTRGFRAQALDLDQNGLIVSIAVTTRHPLPGVNVIDYLHFAIESVFIGLTLLPAEDEKKICPENIFVQKKMYGIKKIFNNVIKP